MPRLWDEDRTAEELCITRRQLRDLRYRREIPYVKVGRLVRFRPAEVEAYLDAQTVEAAR